MDWSQFDSKLDNEMMEKVNKLESGELTNDYPEVPLGKYEVVPEKIELGMSKKGNPQTIIWFRIVAGPYTKSMLFAYLTMNTAFGIHKTKELIHKLQPSEPVKFESFTQWDVYLMGVSEETCCQASYVLNYGETVDKKTGKTYKSFEIEDGPYEVPDTYEAPEPKSDNSWTEYEE